ncbi:MAG: hypothetical protein EU536_01005 [Promethearchaeota archaeon]|nr:MAG: hypothetical protein EU536_01005 [Candidatus Lokiarchaeota archaeon]
MAKNDPSSKFAVPAIIIFLILSIYCVTIPPQGSNLPYSSLSPAPSLESPPTTLYSFVNLSSTGAGKNFDYYETTWGTKTDSHLNGSSSIVWEIPSPWIGNYLDVHISNLTEKITSTESELATGVFSEGGTPSGSFMNTWIFGQSYNWTWSSTALNFTLTFHTDLPAAAITNISIITWSYWKDNPPLKRTVAYYIHNFNSGGNDALSINAPEGDFDWANTTISSGFTDYVSITGDIWLNFYAQQPSGSTGEYYLDFVQLIITCAEGYQPVTPTSVGLVLDDGSTNHTIHGTSGSGHITISGIWTENPTYFKFHAPNHPILFNATSTFYLSRNEQSSVSSTYYLNQSHPNPQHHLWKLEFIQNTFPSANFTNLNFSVSILPSDWEMINATDPDNNPQSLNEIIIPSGKVIAADPSHITSNGTWRLFFTSPNYISSVELRKNSNLLPYNPFLLIWDILDIRSIFRHPVINGNVNLTISFEGKANHTLEYTGVVGNVTNFDPWQINSTTNKNGTYLLTVSFYNNTALGIYTTPVLVGYPTNISILSPDLRYVEFLKGSLINLTIFYENLYPENYYNELGILGAQVQWHLSNSTGYNESGEMISKGEGYYNTTLDTALLGIWDGPYNLTITINKPQYENQSYSIELLCFQTIHPTTAYLKNLQWVIASNYSVELFPNQSLLIQMNYTDTYSTPRLIDHANTSVLLYSSLGQVLPEYSVIGIRSAPGLYQIDFGTIGLSVGHYVLLINSSKTFYENASIWVNCTIKPLEPSIKVTKLGSSTNLTAYHENENLTISFKVAYNATQYDGYSSWYAPIHWGLVTYFIVPYNGDPLNPSHRIKFGTITFNSFGVFQINNLHLSNISGNIAPGDYEIYILSNATDCLPRWYNFNLTIHKKIAVNLNIERYPTQMNPSQLLTIKARLSSSELASPIHFNGKLVIFNITVFYDSASPVNFTLTDLADTTGLAERSFYLVNYVPTLEGIKSVEFNAYFDGMEAYYPSYSFHGASTSTYSMKVVVPFDFSFIIYIVAGIAGGIAAVVIVHRKVLAPREVQKSKTVNYLFTSFRDVVGIQNLFVLLKTTGACILQKTYSPEGIEESMENILCSVIANYGKGEQRDDASCDLIRFEGFMILIDDGDFIRVAVTVAAHPSDKLIRSLVRFVQFFELQNYSLLQSTKGPVESLEGVDDLLDVQFGASLIAPYTLEKLKRLSGFEETMALMAANLMEDHGYFYLSQLYAKVRQETLIEEIMIFGTIQQLIEKKVIVPYVKAKKSKDFSKRLAETEFERIKVDLFSVKNKALKALTDNRYQDAVELYYEAASLAATIGDMHAKNQFLGKAREYSALIKPKSSPKDVTSDIIASDLMGEEPHGPSQVIEDTPQITEPTMIEGVHFKSKTIKESIEALSSPSSIDLLSETTDEATELTPFEQITKAVELMGEGASLDEKMISKEFMKEAEMSEEALAFFEEIVQIAEPTPKTSSLIDEVIKEAEIHAEEPLSTLEAAEEAQIEEILTEIEKEPSVELSRPETEIKTLEKTIDEAKLLLNPLPDALWGLNSTVADLSKQKNKVQRQIKQTSAVVITELKTLCEQLINPKRAIDEELAVAKKEIPRLIKEIDAVDQTAVSIKKEVTTAQKESKKFKEELGRIFSKLSTVDKFLLKTTEKDLLKEIEELRPLKDSFNDAMKNLDDIEKELSTLNQGIVTLMIEDIEQMMAEEQKAEKIINELSKKLSDSQRLQNALSKENSKMNAYFTELNAIISSIDTSSSEIFSQKPIISSSVKDLESATNLQIDTFLQTHHMDSLTLTAEFQALQSRIAENQQIISAFKEKIQDVLKQISKIDKTYSNIEKQKDRIKRALEKAAKFVFPKTIQQQNLFIADFDAKIHPLIQKGHQTRKALNDELQNTAQNLIPKIKSLPDKLQKLSKSAIKAAQKVERLEDDKFFQDITASLEDTSEPIAPPIEETTLSMETDELSDTELGIKQHCPYCNKIIPEKILNLLRKGFAPECSNCGEIIKPNDVELN